MTVQKPDPGRHAVVAVFGATGTIGDGLLKAAMNDPHVRKIHVITRRPSPRIEEGVAAGKVVMTMHEDYLDYSAIRGIMTELDAVFWALGLSGIGLDRETYRRIHVTFPLLFAEEWQMARPDAEVSLHYVSGAGAAHGSRMMWASEKALAEQLLAAAADGTNLRVISYRPAFIRPTEAELNIGHKVLHAVFAPIGKSVRAESIGEAMLQISSYGTQIYNGYILENRDIVAFGEAYREQSS